VSAGQDGAEPQPTWKHAGPCVYCEHGPHCARCDFADSPNFRTGEQWPGPVCRACVEEIKRAEIAADPYNRGDYYAMFGDDE
jgi:hypothetical protein